MSGHPLGSAGRAPAAVAQPVRQLDELAELRAEVADLRASRARLVAAGDAERRRLERDLHDGAQSRLVALAVKLRHAERRFAGQPELTALLAGSSAELQAGLEELRELARGIHPAVLTQHGLEPALAALAERAPLSVELAPPPPAGLPAPVEAAIYFVVAEGLTNVAKYADAERAAVRVLRGPATVVAEVADDGVGGAGFDGGSGLRGLADRVAALGGRLELHSPPGEGTRVRVEIPL